MVGAVVALCCAGDCAKNGLVFWGAGLAGAAGVCEEVSVRLSFAAGAASVVGMGDVGGVGREKVGELVSAGDGTDGCANGDDSIGAAADRLFSFCISLVKDGSGALAGASSSFSSKVLISGPVDSFFGSGLMTRSARPSPVGRSVENGAVGCGN